MHVFYKMLCIHSESIPWEAASRNTSTSSCPPIPSSLFPCSKCALTSHSLACREHSLDVKLFVWGIESPLSNSPVALLLYSWLHGWWIGWETCTNMWERWEVGRGSPLCTPVQREMRCRCCVAVRAPVLFPFKVNCSSLCYHTGNNTWLGRY